MPHSILTSSKSQILRYALWISEFDFYTQILSKLKKNFFRDEHNTLTAEYTKVTATHKATHESLLMVKVVARKIREEKIKLSAENEKLQVLFLSTF